MMDIHLALEQPFSHSCELFILKLCPHSKIQKKHDMKNPTESTPMWEGCIMLGHLPHTKNPKITAV